ncbi:methionine--tRNA ligase, mitochondrial-like isoform X2 [Bombus pascuorum]|uniref:methionine--tRNA ligase, mitochondrial-like isoform X2 n=1 Tax=Bombus pascuorum TaxID=65598 RepID=UPI00212E77F0|nr:methionine--tRNA ligase, mitochondrial-like isoform X2 [Bombus pascuorum]
MAISSQAIRLPILISMKNVFFGTNNCNKRYIMTTCTKLEKVLERLEKNPYFEKYANKIAKFQQTSPEEFLQRVENEEKKIQGRKVTVHLSRSCHIQSLWMFPFVMTRTQPWNYVKKRNFSDHAMKSIYITTPIFYVNAGPHIGHLYTAVLADTIARFNAMLGHSVFLCTGTDEHGMKVQKAASNVTLPIPEYCTQVSCQFQEMCDVFDVEYSKFIRTTEERHQEAVLNFWNRLEKNGYIYQGKYSGWYNVSEEAFVPDKDVVKKNPANINEAYTESGDVLEWMEEECYKFRLSCFKDELKHWLKNANVIEPEMYRTSLIPWIDNLQDLSISRPIKRVPWAIPTPSDKSHTVYVWLDALVNYLTSVGYPDDSFRKFWPPTVQVIGKDILKFHGIYWPAFLMAAGLELPEKLICHGHWAVKDKKMSKSKGNVISPFEAMHNFTQDGLRYFLLRQAVLHSDANYNNLKIQKVLNSELADTLGNLINRCFGKSINPDGIIYNSAEYTNILKSEIARKNVVALEELSEKAKEYYEKYNLYYTVDIVMNMLRIANQMFEHHRPWELSKAKDPDSVKQLEAVISLALENLRVAALVLYPIIPKSASNLLDVLQVSKSNRTWEDTKPIHLTNASNETRHVLTQNILFFKKIKN